MNTLKILQAQILAILISIATVIIDYQYSEILIAISIINFVSTFLIFLKDLKD